VLEGTQDLLDGFGDGHGEGHSAAFTPPTALEPTAR